MRSTGWFGNDLGARRRSQKIIWVGNFEYLHDMWHEVEFVGFRSLENILPELRNGIDNSSASCVESNVWVHFSFFVEFFFSVPTEKNMYFLFFFNLELALWG